MELCNVYIIGTETTEPHHPHQNPAENRIGTVKMVANRVMGRSGCPANLWLRAVVIVSMIMNAIGHRTSTGAHPQRYALAIRLISHHL